MRHRLPALPAQVPHAPPTLHRWPGAPCPADSASSSGASQVLGLLSGMEEAFLTFPLGCRAGPSSSCGSYPGKGFLCPEPPGEPRGGRECVGQGAPQPRQSREAERAERREKGCFVLLVRKLAQPRHLRAISNQYSLTEGLSALRWLLFPSEILHPFRFLFSLLPTWVYFLN